MELDDCAFPLLESIDIYDDAKQAFDGANVAFLIGARPRSKGMERADLLEANGAIFKPQGEALNAGAADDIKVLVVGNPANTNALIAQSNAPDIPAERFTAMTRLDENRAVAMLAKKARRRRRGRQGPRHLGQPLADDVPRPVQREGERQVGRRRHRRRHGLVRERVHAEGRQARRGDHRGARRLVGGVGGVSAAIDHVQDWVQGADGLRSMAVPSDGSYGIDEGLICSVPVRCSGGSYERETGLELGDFAKAKLEITVNELTRGARGRQEARPGLGAALQGAALGRVLREPAAALLAHLPVLLEAGEDAVEVVLLDAHLLGHLGDGDARAARGRSPAPRWRACPTRAGARGRAGAAAAAA